MFAQPCYSASLFFMAGFMRQIESQGLTHGNGAIYLPVIRAIYFPITTPTLSSTPNSAR